MRSIAQWRTHIEQENSGASVCDLPAEGLESAPENGEYHAGGQSDRETHVFRQQKAMHDIFTEGRNRYETWSSMACGQNEFFHNLVQDIMIIPKSTRKERMEENKNIIDFELIQEEMERIVSLD